MKIWQSIHYRSWLRKIFFLGCAYLGGGLIQTSQGETAVDQFYAPQVPGVRLPASGIYPQGRKLAYMGYSGEPARDLTNGFTVAGPVYGNELPYILRCVSNGWPVVAQIGLPIKFTAAKSNAIVPEKAALERVIQERVQALVAFTNITWWAVTPEELRPWAAKEMNYLETVCTTIRRADPLHRPIYLYNPNHRDAHTLAPIARQVDIVAKGTYVNSVGRERERAWVRWSVEQEIAAIRAAGRPGAIPLLNPELCKDPEPAEDGKIRTWVRHDIYLGLASGAKGVLIWSLFQRSEVRRTWQLWYDAYAECGRELNGPRGLAQVFLFGSPRSDLKIHQLDGEATVLLTLGGRVEAGTTSEQERSTRSIQVPAWTSAEFAYGDSRWLFLINSANSPSRFEITGWPSGSLSRDAFTDAIVPLNDTEGLPVTLPANGVFAVRFSHN